MIEPSPEPVDTPPARNSAALGCVLLLAAWIVGLAFVIYPAVWLVEQFALIGGETVGRVQWIGAVAVHALAVLLPSLAGIALVHSARYRSIFQLWALAGLFALLVLPVQIVPPPATQTASLLQIIGAAVYLILLRRLVKRREIQPSPPGGVVWPGVFIAALIIWPWVAWGALGSWLDTTLGLTAALVFGLAAGHTLGYFLFPWMIRGGDEPTLSFGLSGLAAGVALVTMGAAFGYNGQQLFLLCLLSVIGWLVAAVARWERGEAEGSNRLAAALFVGLVVAAPLLFVDPDELGLILNYASRDILYYAFRAALIGLGTALALTVPAWLLSRRPGGHGRLLPIGLTTAACIGLAALYFLVGQPGWSGERLYVILADQADLSAAATIPDPEERRIFAYQTLVQHADETQAGIRQTLDARGIDYRPYYLMNAIEVDAGPFVRRWLESRPEVDRVLDSPELRPLPVLVEGGPGTAGSPGNPQWNLVDIGAPHVWEQFGIRGAGIVIGQSDSGVDGAHPELRDQYRGNQAGGPTGDEFNWYDPWYGSTDPTDYGGHGTHTLGSALGRTVGVAPEASWIGCVNLGRNLGNAPRYLDCLQFMLAPFPQGGDPLHDGRPELGANVLNNSWGCPTIEGCDPASLLPAVQNLRAAGVFVVASAGNDGDACGTINAPISLYDEVFTVGATDAGGAIAPFSSRGPVTADGSGRTKPDVVAPGVNVLSSYPGGTFEYNSGTSMAGPHVVGVVALLWSADPSLIGDIDRTETILIETAQPVFEPFDVAYCGEADERPNNTVGYGLVDAHTAVARVLAEAGE